MDWGCGSVLSAFLVLTKPWILSSLVYKWDMEIQNYNLSLLGRGRMISVSQGYIKSSSPVWNREPMPNIYIFENFLRSSSSYKFCYAKLNVRLGHKFHTSDSTKQSEPFFSG